MKKLSKEVLESWVSAFLKSNYPSVIMQEVVALLRTEFDKLPANEVQEEIKNESK
jgi:hypothetical protein